MKGPLTEEYLLHKGKADRLDKICSLDLSSHGVTSLDVGLFNELVSLKTLDVSRNRLTSFPANLRLKQLRVLDCCDNDLQSVLFVGKLKGLKELYLDGNAKLMEEDHYIAKVLCPSLQRIDDDTDMEHVTSGINLYKQHLSPQIKAVWEARFAEVYSKGISLEEVEKLHQVFVDTVTKAGVVGSNLTMPKLKDVMIGHLCRELLVSVNAGTYSVGRRSDKYGTRVSQGTTPVKDYRTMNSGDKKTPEKGSRPGTPSQSTKKRKRQSTPSAYPAAKRLRKEGGVTPCSPMDMAKANRVQLPAVDDFEPTVMLRCHSKDNSPADHSTKVWKCAFEPRLANSEEPTILATCGGNVVCFIDCQTGKVMKRYKDNHKKESFYSLAWTTLKADGDNLKEDCNILAVAGEDCKIKLIHPRQLMMFGTLTGHKGYVSSLVFHPTKPHILFSSSRDKKIIMWEIGTPDFKDNSIDWSKKAVLRMQQTDAISIVLDPGLDMLVAGCDQSCFGWDLARLNKKKSPVDVLPDVEFVHPQDDGEDHDQDVTVDGLVMLANHCIVSKCVGQSCLYVWDLRASVAGLGKKQVAVPVQPLAQLMYTPVDIDFLYPQASSNVLCVGDDEGRVHMYNLRSLVKKKRKSDCVLQASAILESPELIVDTGYQTSMTDLANQEDVVVNCVALSENHEYLAYGTDNNLVSIWKNTTKL